jgi:hypothetical protein
LGVIEAVGFPLPHRSGPSWCQFSGEAGDADRNSYVICAHQSLPLSPFVDKKSVFPRSRTERDRYHQEGIHHADEIDGTEANATWPTPTNSSGF